MFYNFDENAATLEANKIVIILKTNDSECLHATYENYTECEDLNTNNTIINPSLIKIIYPPYSTLIPYNKSDLTGDVF